MHIGNFEFCKVCPQLSNLVSKGFGTAMTIAHQDDVKIQEYPTLVRFLLNYALDQT